MQENDSLSATSYNKRAVGNTEEDVAVRFLTDKGCRILERNFRMRGGEIDVIFLDDDGETVVFGEVKYRKNLKSGYPEESVNLKKQRVICRVSDYYRARMRLDEGTSFRYDVIAIMPEGIRWHKNAFEYIRR